MTIFLMHFQMSLLKYFSKKRKTPDAEEDESGI